MLILRNREELEHELVTRHAAGWSIRALTRHFQMGRNAVRRILRANRAARDGEEGAEPSRKGALRTARRSKLDPYAGRIAELLEKYPDLTGERLYEILRDEGYTGRISIVRDRLRKVRPRPKKQPVVRFETGPGVQGQMDWSPYAIPFTREGRKEVLCFSYILSYSRRHYIDFVYRRDFHTLVRRHQDAFDYFDGTPRHCLYDGEKTVLLRWEAGRPVYNPAFVAFATHYRFKPLGCRPGRPKTKGKIERPFQYVETNLLGGREFADLEDLRAVSRWWLAERSDRHVHDTTGRSPLELFLADEQASLQALPHNPYDADEVALRVCGVEGFVEFETNRYSVPYEYVAEILTLKASEREIFIYSPEIDLLARHERFPAGAGRLAEDPAHRQAKGVRYGLEPVREAFLRLGEAAEAFLAGLARTFPRNGGFHARIILRLKERYHAEDIHRALQHAALYQAFDGKAVERIVTARAMPRTLESVRNEAAARSLSQALPEIRQRPLAEYAGFFQPRRAPMNHDLRGTADVAERIRQRLLSLKLHRMAAALDGELERSTRERLPVSEVLLRLLDAEACAAQERRMERRIRESRLPERKLLADFDFSFQPGLDKAQVMELATLSFVKRRQGLILAGSSGAGKSHLAKALLLLGCRGLYRCRYATAAGMLKDLLAGLADGSLEQRLKAYTAPDLLLIDEVGFDRLEQESARNASLFFKVVDGRYCKGSTMLTTNIDFKALGDYLGDPVITTAIVDRLVHHSIIITIDGPSFRMHQSKQLNHAARKKDPAKD